MPGLDDMDTDNNYVARTDSLDCSHALTTSTYGTRIQSNAVKQDVNPQLSMLRAFAYVHEIGELFGYLSLSAWSHDSRLSSSTDPVTGRAILSTTTP